jgi:hypothetical protein
MSAMTSAFLRSGCRLRTTVAPPATVQPGLLLMPELAPIADAGAGGRDESCGPKAADPTPFEGAENQCKIQSELPAGRAKVP